MPVHSRSSPNTAAKVARTLGCARQCHAALPWGRPQSEANLVPRGSLFIGHRCTGSSSSALTASSSLQLPTSTMERRSSAHMRSTAASSSCCSTSATTAKPNLFSTCSSCAPPSRAMLPKGTVAAAASAGSIMRMCPSPFGPGAAVYGGSGSLDIGAVTCWSSASTVKGAAGSGTETGAMGAAGVGAVGSPTGVFATATADNLSWWRVGPAPAAPGGGGAVSRAAGVDSVATPRWSFEVDGGFVAPRCFLRWPEICMFPPG
mmetsp:Transcript_53903/g.165870  ORF Transcript_53903/g.165870 Transcript_53903/m.165870 type:complete len:261 (-) Transcript_53903:40-822(-)